MKPRYFVALFKNQDKPGAHLKGLRWRYAPHTRLHEEDIMEEGFVLTAMYKPAAGAELANTAAAPKTPHIRALQ